MPNGTLDPKCYVTNANQELKARNSHEKLCYSTINQQRIPRIPVGFDETHLANMEVMPIAGLVRINTVRNSQIHFSRLHKLW